MLLKDGKYMKNLFKFIFLTVIISAMLLFAASAADNVVFLKDGGTGDGTSAETPVGTLAKAFIKLNLEKDATIVICGPFTQSADFAHGALYGGSITFTSVYDGVDYRENGAVWQFNSTRYACYGTTVFENIDFVSLGGYYRIVGQHNAVTLGNGISISGEGLAGTTLATSFAILGGYEKGFGGGLTLDNGDVNITVLSGTYLYIVPFSHNTRGTYLGNANVYIGGSADVYRLLAGATYNSVALGDVHITLDGEADVHLLYGSVGPVNLNSFEFEWRSGTFQTFTPLNGESSAFNVANAKVLRITDTKAATMHHAALAAKFDTVVTDKDTAVAPDFISEEESALISLRGSDFTAVNFSQASEKTQISLKVPATDATNGSVYRINGEFWDKVDADPVGNGLMAFDLTLDGTYVCGTTDFFAHGDVNRDRVLSILDIGAMLHVALGDRAVKYDTAAADFDQNHSINLLDVIRFAKALVAGEGENTEPFNPDDYNVITVTRYLDKTKLGFLSQIVGFLSGYEFARDPVTKLPMLAMADSYFEMCNGAYADPKDFNLHGDKHLYNEETGIWEVWNDDDFSIDILDQYILRDMYAQYGTVNTKVITDDWIKYDVYDMGGGNRDIGAYGLMKNYQYLSVFSGNTEMCNNFNVNGEPYIGNETLGMVSAGMPNLAVELAHKFGSTTSDRDPLEWLKMFAAMYSLAYFENDIPTIIRTAQRSTMPEGTWPYEVVDKCFELYEKHDNWRDAIIEADKIFRSLSYDNSSYMGCSSINCSFIILGLLYGEGDYYETCKIISLAGHGGDSTTPTALGVVGVVCGWTHLDATSKGIIEEKVWQNGNGVIVNRPLDPDGSYGTWMHMAALEERFNIKELIYLYQANFENILFENGGFKLGGSYYIPKQTFAEIETVYTEHFENGGIADYIAESGTVQNPADPFMGAKAIEVVANENGSGLAYTTVSGLSVGEKYSLSAFIRTADGATGHMFVRENDKDFSDYETVHDSNVYIRRFTTGVGENDMCSYVKRTLVFVATAPTMEIGFVAEGGGVAADAIVLTKFEESTVADVTVYGAQNEDGAYNGLIRFEIEGGADKEAWLKLTYASNATALEKKITLVNRSWQSRTPIVPTNGGKVTIYIPVLVNKDANNLVTMFVGDTDVTVYEATLVNAKF